MWWSSCCGLDIVLLCLMNVAHIQAQCQRPYIGGNRVMAEGTYEDTYANGVTLTFKCAPGYVSVYPSASKTITCQEGTWSRLELHCKRRSCGNPGDILNGAYDLTNGIEYGSIATVKCNKGYELVGQISIRKCLETGIWDGLPPLCEAVRCPKPPSIANGEIDSNEDFYTYNQEVTYSCVGGTFLFGAKILTCSADKMFKPDPPECTSVRCPAVRITNGFRARGKYAQSYELKEFLQFHCDDGYEMEGADYIMCQQNGWEPPPPKCRRRSCGNPGDILNGEYNLTNGFEYGSIATVKCNEGYELTGQITSRKCLGSGAWDGLPPLCEAVRCPKPPSIANGQIDSNEDFYTYNQAVTYSCVGGTFLFGAKTLTCSADGKFKPDPPECMSVRCPAVRIANGFRTAGKPAQSYELREFLQFKCVDGYKMEGADYIVCQQNGWEPPPPTCRK